MKIVFATNNEHKLREVRQILDGKYEVMSLDDLGCHDDIPETADTLDGNALQKARYVHERYGVDVFADDTGLEVDALGGAPGVHTARYAGDSHDTQANVDKLLREMEGNDDRRACFRTAIALIKDGEEHLFEGRVDGEITCKREGDGGFGYDPVFRPEGYDGSFAQLGESVKNSISHRARAVQQLVRFLAMLVLALISSTASTASIASMASNDWNDWTVYPAYGDAKQLVCADGVLWCVSSGHLWSYDMENEELTTYDHANGLSGVSISRIAYSSAAHCIVIVYANSNIDILDTRTGGVQNVAAIADSDIAQREVCDLFVHGNEAWLATQFGIVVIDLDNGIVKDSFNYASKIYSVAVSDGGEPVVYAVIDQKLMCAPLGDALYDKASFKQFSNAGAKRVMCWNGKIVLHTNDNRGYIIDANGSGKQLVSQATGLVDIQPCENKLVMLNKNYVIAMDKEGAVSVYSLPNTFNSVVECGDGYIAADGYNGLTRLAVDGNKLVAQAMGVQPNGPRLATSTKVHYLGNRLTHTTGGADYKGLKWFAGAFDVMEDGQWMNLDTVNIHYQFPYHNMLELVEDPLHEGRYYGCSYASGVYMYEGTTLKERYTQANSIIEKAGSSPDKYSRVTSLAFDNEGTLWMINTNALQPIVYKTADDQWGKLESDIPQRIEMGGDIVAHGNYRWFVSKTMADLSKIGIYCVDTNGTTSDQSDDRSRWRNSTIVQQDGVEYKAQNLYSLVADDNGQLWLGTDMGLFVIPSADAFLSNDFTYQQIKVNREDGSGLADYLFNGVNVTAIAVDKANRKWIGTNGQGVYLVSGDGQRQLLHFTTGNSPLPNDLVNSIAVNRVNGDVAIATEQGLAVYHAGDLTYSDKLDEDNIVVYPNPVPAQYDRPVTISGTTNSAEVKVTTVTGQVIYRTQAVGGQAKWNMRDARGQRVATGVYNIIINEADGSEAVIKRLVVTN